MSAPGSEAIGELLQWLTNDTAAQRLLVAERESCQSLLAALPGQTLLEISPMPGLTPRDGVRLLRLAPPGARAADALSSPDHLPLWPASMSLVVMHHILEISPNPRRAAAEAALTVREGGYLLVVAFNRGLSRWLYRMPSQRRAPPLRRLRHWMLTNGMQPLQVAYCDSFFPHRLFGRSCVMLARKERILMIPRRRTWRIRAAEWVGQPTAAAGFGQHRLPGNARADA